MDAVWALLFAAGAAIVVTYSRLPPDDLYNVSEEGLALGLGRALVFLNYPVSLAAIPIAWLAADRIGSRRATWAAAAATALCGVTALPGVVDQDDLDAKPVNVLPAVGVAVALALTVRAPWERVGRLPLDPVRLGIGVVVWAFALVWVASVLGPAVHRGDHEGLDAALLVTAALVLTRYRPRFAIAWLLGLALAYGLAVEWRDFWFEQLTKRRWTDWVPPQVLTPRLSVAWAALVLLGLTVALVLRRLEAPARPG